MVYSDVLLDHYRHPRNVGSFDTQDPSVGTGMVGSPAQGDVIRLQIRVDDAGMITDTCFKTYGCTAAIASSSLISEWLKGKTLKQALDISNAEIASALELPPLKIHCSILAENAIRAAVNNFQDKG